ncbi:terminase gpA endonuclease subunit [Teredinibacter sp. KSP-S5-2]|uniref:terminase gpA endonuclease subunit n=1 Tax=Teredinibacter sp. KSP-S5-2 TaxID=3034506 RepID=UPI0029347B8D|nr:terminase gpA endonuclease subunit [Teredinibacter sp. KSP-S5-2]WNO10422.1 phage terminase large subunit family protein [Teredinibacter sp. KSP-S5-2]
MHGIFDVAVDYYDGIDAIENAWKEGTLPDPLLTVSQWSEAHRVLSAKTASEPGRWRNSRTPYLVDIMDCLSVSSPEQRVAFMKGSQVGGPLCVTTPIPTVDGWKTMAELRVGDWLFAEDGKPCRVMGVSPVMVGAACYEITFDDGESVVCDSDHRWVVWVCQSKKQDIQETITTQEMFDSKLTFLQGGSKRYHFAVDVCQSVSLPKRDLLIHPYVLGVWLGDGSSQMNHISVNKSDAEVDFHCSSFMKALEYLDVLDNKHIPSDYLRASIDQRFALLQGLMDSDGDITKQGYCSFSNTNTRLIEGVKELAKSLGYKVGVQYKAPITKAYPNGNSYTSQPCWRLSWTAYREQPVFRLTRKLKRMRSVHDGQLTRSKRRKIVSIEQVASRPVRCIEVNSPSHLYLCGKGWIPTHNTEAGVNWTGYVVHHSPGPMLSVAPTVDMAKRNSRQRIDPLIEDVPAIRERIAPARSRDSSNTVLSKEFNGGVLVMTGANSAVGLRSMPARYLFLDEVDGYPGDVDGEGDPILLAERRSATFSRRRKIFLVSTPTLKSTSRILREFLQSDQRYYFVPCPHCGHKQRLVFSRFKWPKGNPDSVEYICESCERGIAEHHKTKMLAEGEWIATAEGDGITVGFHLSSLYSPLGWFSWADAVRMYEQALKHPELMKGFINTVLGEAYEEEFEAPDWTRLYERREDYPMGVVPENGLFLTAGVDVQKDRIECEVVAWCRNRESFSVEYFILQGNTAEQTVWNKLEKVLNTDFPHARGGTLPIRVMSVDSGYNTQTVYSWVKKFPQAVWGGAGARASQPRTVVAIKGRDKETALISSVSNVDIAGKRSRLKLWNLGVPVAKAELYGWLKLPKPTDEQFAKGEGYPAGYCHFPQYGEEFFKQITAERRVIRIKNGFPKAVWEKDAGQNNEALDCRVYNRAAAMIYGLDRFRELHWLRLEKAIDAMAGQYQKNHSHSVQSPKINPLQGLQTMQSDDPFL